MLARLKQSWFVWLLLVCLVLVNGAMAAPSVGHAEHHTDHQAGTHSTGLCAWLCAGGVGIESSVVPFSSGLQIVEQISIVSFDIVFSVISLSRFFRGPPLLA